VIVDQPVLFWGIITSMWIGNLMLVIINLPLIGVWVSLLKVPYRLLAPLIILTCAVGVFSVNNSTFDILLMVVFGLLGYFLMLMKCEPAPLVLGFILGPMMEENLRRALLLSRGSYMTFIERPISLGLLVVCALLLASLVIPAIRSKRKEAFEE
jgi:TctA family transporter